MPFDAAAPRPVVRIGILLAALVSTSLFAAALRPVSAGATAENAQALSNTSTPFYAIARAKVPLPAGVMPWGAVWTPDGEHILFQDYQHPSEWIADADGTNARCLTCSMTDRPNILPGFVYAFPDNRRMFVANELGAKAHVLECSPSLVDCRTHTYLKVDLSSDNSLNRATIDHRTYHLSPDGEHLGYTLVRSDGLLMVVARIERRPDRYLLTNPRVVNPRGPSGLLDQSAAAWARGASLYELKSFVDGGRKILAFSEDHGVPEQVEIDLATGAVRRLATYPDWNEDGATSPDESMLLTASWRTQNRMESLAVLPAPVRPSPLVPVFPAVGLYYISSRPGFACDLQPWLLPADGDQGGTLVGQPLNPYMGGQEIGANNLSGQQVWSPDSTRVLLQGRTLDEVPGDANDYLTQKGPARSELLIAHIERTPTTPKPVHQTAVGAWAPAPQTYTSSYDLPGTRVLKAASSGTVTYSNLGNVAGGVFTATYKKFSDDGKNFISGTVSRDGSAVALDRIDAKLQVTDSAGADLGSMEAHLSFTHVLSATEPGDPTTDMSGSVTSTWGGRTYRGLPRVGPCTESLPRPSRLSASVTPGSSPGAITVVVTSEISGDRRPVQGAHVELLGQAGVTDAGGAAHFVLDQPATGTTDLEVVAGDTFMPLRTTASLD